MLGYESEKLQELKAIFTAEEICQQSVTWSKTFKQIKERKAEISAFIAQVVDREDFDIIFTGAGTSEFVGNALYSSLAQKYDFKVKSYATTDLVPSPARFVSPTKTTLLISFGRSGSSPESLGAIEACNAVAGSIYHLFITCNPEGEMAKWSEKHDNCLGIILTPETCDRSFAMTSSFTNMMLAAYLCLNLDTDFSAEIEKAKEAVDHLLDEGYHILKSMITDFDFRRIVYLGSNTLKGFAQESALKMLELTAGEVVTMFDSPLGFRHGPKSVINNETLTVFYLSGEEHSQKYEIDLIKEMSHQRKGDKILLVGSKLPQEVKEYVDYSYCFKGMEGLSNLFLGLGYVVVAQIIALYKSLSLNITTDNPCPSGEVNRVVTGVTIYPYSG